MNEIAIKQKAFDTHARIMANGQILQNTLLEICKDLKAMRDERLYIELGYETFEDYAENAVGIKQRQAYSYISTYEKLGEKYVENNANLGITKLELISQISSYERDEFLSETDAESASVRELKEQVENFKKQTEQLTFTINEQQAEIERCSSAPNEETQKLKEKIAELEEKLLTEKNNKPEQDAATLEQMAIEASKKAELEYKELLKAEKAKAKTKLNQAVENAKNESQKKIRELEEKNEALKNQKTSVEQKLEEAEKKAKVSGADPKVTMLKVYFDELQNNLSTLFTLLAEIENDDKTTADKLKNAIVTVLRSTADANK